MQELLLLQRAAVWRMQVGRLELSCPLQCLPVQDSDVVIFVTNKPFTAQRFHRAIDVHAAETKRVGDLRLCYRKLQDAVAGQPNRFHSMILFTDQVSGARIGIAAICPGRPVFLFFEGGAMNFIEKSAITTNEYWLRVYRSCPNFAQ